MSRIALALSACALALTLAACNGAPAPTAPDARIPALKNTATDSTSALDGGTGFGGGHITTSDGEDGTTSVQGGTGIGSGY